MAERERSSNSIGKALDIVEDLSEYGPSSLADLHRRLGLDKGTLHRILKTLKERGYVRQNQGDRRYFNSIRMFQLGGREIARSELRVLARPYLEKLAAAFKEVIHVAIMVDNDKAILVDKLEALPGAKMRLNIALGAQVSLYASSIGKCLLAFADQAVQARILPKIKYERLSPSTIRGAVALKKELTRIKAQGFAVDDGETLESVYCVAAPVLAHSGSAYAAISVSGPRSRMLEMKNEIIRTLKVYSKELSLLYGLPPDKWPFKD
ncbi:MAG: IclR family transcriptional regulator [Candidatus Adiutrix sp.]|jgi:DNA-binding IclR family transcriptional regulator|nr:IclR family transcriptional regulator [Candidatus Adiutrix sp.]